jgi:outer membrane protein TolC
MTQRLPYGGQVVAQWIGTMVRDLENHVTNSESGTAIVSANIPLLRGGGRVAYESRYQGERNLIYAVRSYERFRRRFLTDVAGQYFNLLSTKGSIRNSIAARQSTRDNWERSQARADAEKIIQLEADRANNSFLSAQNSVAVAQENYESDLDEFKIRIGMPTTNLIDVVEEGLDLPEPSVTEEMAIETATRLRLDLLNTRDRVDDVRRSVEIARNNLLPDLDLSGSVSYSSNPDHQSAFHFREDDETWDLGVDLEIPLDRKAERNTYRSSIISLRRAERGYDEALDLVRLDVRRARRQIDRTKFSIEIQLQNIRSNELQLESAQIRFEKGEIDNQAIVDANDNLLEARNDYDRDVSEFRRAVLAFRLATGTLRVGEDGRWLD